ncbi:MAG: GDSL-type esterase/lipase family protein, partial [Tannerella sp.]|jgi:hypothetical protein|nr:GDSL-type esterase/lipase family protein [Tannerella sp.]
VPIAITGNTEGIYPIARNLPQGEHELIIRKASTTNEGLDIYFHGIKTDGSLLDASVNKPLKIEYFGNSISAGSGAGAANFPLADSHFDSSLSYTCLLSELLDAEYHNTSYAGIALCNGAGWLTFGMESIYDRLYPTGTSQAWNFSKFKPDICVMALGVNDNNRPGDIAWDTWRERYKQMVLKLRDEYGENTIFIFSVGPMSGPSSNAVIHGKQVVNELKTAGIKAYSYVYSFGTSNGKHPIAPQQLQMAKELYTYIKNEVLIGDNAEKNTLSYNNSCRKVLYNIRNTSNPVYSITVYDAWGDPKYAIQNPIGNGEINVSALQKGSYSIRMEQQTGESSKNILIY